MGEKQKTTAQKEFILDTISKTQDDTLIKIIYELLVRIIEKH